MKKSILCVIISICSITWHSLFAQNLWIDQGTYMEGAKNAQLLNGYNFKIISDNETIFLGAGEGGSQVRVVGNTGQFTVMRPDRFETDGNIHANGDLTIFGHMGLGCAPDPYVALTINENSSNSMIGFSRNNTSYGAVGVNTINQMLVQGNYVPIRFSANGFVNEHMRIQPNGYVGIGTSNPTSNLHIKSSDIVYFSIGRLNEVDDFTLISNVNASSIYASSAGESTKKDLVFYSCGVQAGERMRIKATGEIGIGTTTPQAKLDVNGTILAGSMTIDGTTGGLNVYGSGCVALFGSDPGAIKIGNQSGAFVGGSHNSGNLLTYIASNIYSNGSAWVKQYPDKRTATHWMTNGDHTFLTGTETDNLGTAKMVILNDGKVGIGLTNPDAQFHVKSSESPAQFALGLTGSNRDFYISSTEYNTSICASGGGLGTEKDLIFNRNGTSAGETMRITKDGDVAIGTTAPQAKLDVAGDIKCDGLVIKDWRLGQATLPPDYVFSSEYKLQSLKETEQFVKKNKHLPGVPNAKEFQEKGMDVVAMNFTLLKKIEEITLHMIQQQKLLEQQMQIIEKQQKQIDALGTRE